MDVGLIKATHLFLRVLLKIHSFVFGRKRQTSFVFVSFSAENELSLSAVVSFSAVNVKLVFGRSLQEIPF